MGTTRRVIRWVLVGRSDGLRADVRRRFGCLTWLDRGAAPGADPAEPTHRDDPGAAAEGPMGGTPLVPLDEVPPGTVIEVVAGDRALAVANVDGEIIVVDGVCPHAGGPLGDGHLEGCTLTCPWHGWSYDLRTGKSLVVEDVALRRHPARVIDGMIVLTDG